MLILALERILIPVVVLTQCECDSLLINYRLLIQLTVLSTDAIRHYMQYASHDLGVMNAHHLDISELARYAPRRGPGLGPALAERAPAARRGGGGTAGRALVLLPPSQPLAVV